MKDMPSDYEILYSKKFLDREFDKYATLSDKLYEIVIHPKIRKNYDNSEVVNNLERVFINELYENIDLFTDYMIGVPQEEAYEVYFKNKSIYQDIVELVKTLFAELKKEEPNKLVITKTALDMHKANARFKPALDDAKRLHKIYFPENQVQEKPKGIHKIIAFFKGKRGSR